MKRLALVLLLLASVARAQLAGHPLTAAGAPTFDGPVTFTTDFFMQASANGGDFVANGTGANPGVCVGGASAGINCGCGAGSCIGGFCVGGFHSGEACVLSCTGGACGFTGFRFQADVTNTGTVRREYIGGWTDDPTNRSFVVETIGDGSIASKQYVFLNGHLGSGATFGAPTLTSLAANPFGLESTDTTMSLVTGSAGTDQTVDKPLIVSSNGIALGSATRPARMLSVTFTNLGTPPVGTMVYCSDCAPASSPCTGSSTGTIANRINGGTPAWKCL